MVFDRAAVLNCLGGGSVLLNEFLCLYLREMPKQIASVEESFVRKDLARLNREGTAARVPSTMPGRWSQGGGPGYGDGCWQDQNSRCALQYLKEP